MKEILFVETPRDYQTSLQFLKTRNDSPENLLVVNLNTCNVFDYGGTGVAYKIETDYLSKDTLQGINERALELGKTWFADPVLRPLLEVEGLNAGLLLESFLVRQLIGIYKYVNLAKVILSREQCRKVILIDHPQDAPTINSLLPSNNEKVINGVLEILRDSMSLQLSIIASARSGRADAISKTPFVKRCVEPFANLVRNAGNTLLKNGPHRSGSKAIALVGAPRLIFPAIDELEKELDMPLVYFQDALGPRMVGKLWRKKIRYKVSDDYRASGENKLRDRHHQELGARLSRLLSHPGFRDLVAWGGMDVTPVLEDRLRFAFQDCLPDVLVQVERFKRFFAAENIGAIVIDETLRGEFSRPLILTAHSCGIQSVELQHGIPDCYMVQRMVTSKLAVWGNYCKDRYTAESRLNGQDVIVTGSPALDSLRTRDEQNDSAMVRRLLNVDPRHRIISFTAPPFHRGSRGGIIDEHFTRGELEYTLGKILEAVGALEGVHLVIKLHPSEPNARHAVEFIQKSGYAKPYSVVQNFDVYRLIKSSEALLSMGSTTILESILLETPVVLIDFAGKPQPNPYAQWGAVALVDRPENLKKIMRNILADKARTRKACQEGREKVLREFACGADGDSGKRLASLLKNLPSATTRWKTNKELEVKRLVRD